MPLILQKKFNFFSCGGNISPFEANIFFSWGGNILSRVVEIFLWSLLLIFSVQLNSQEGRWGKIEATKCNDIWPFQNVFFCANIYQKYMAFFKIYGHIEMSLCKYVSAQFLVINQTPQKMPKIVNHYTFWYVFLIPWRAGSNGAKWEKNRLRIQNTRCSTFNLFLSWFFGNTDFWQNLPSSLFDTLNNCFLFFCVLWVENCLNGNCQWQWSQYKM